MKLFCQSLKLILLRFFRETFYRRRNILSSDRLFNLLNLEFNSKVPATYLEEKMLHSFMKLSHWSKL